MSKRPPLVQQKGGIVSGIFMTEYWGAFWGERILSGSAIWSPYHWACVLQCDDGLLLVLKKGTGPKSDGSVGYASLVLL